MERHINFFLDIYQFFLNYILQITYKIATLKSLRNFNIKIVKPRQIPNRDFPIAVKCKASSSFLIKMPMALKFHTNFDRATVSLVLVARVI